MHFNISHDNDQTVIFITDSNHRVILVTPDNCDIAHMSTSQFLTMRKRPLILEHDADTLQS